MIEKKIIPSGKAILLSLPENQRTVIQRCVRVLFIFAGKLKKSSGLVFLGLLNRKKKNASKTTIKGSKDGREREKKDLEDSIPKVTGKATK